MKTAQLSGWCANEAAITKGTLKSEATPDEFHAHCQMTSCDCPKHKAVAA